MESFTILDPEDRSFPFGKEVFEDQRALYHGSWSTWSSRIEVEGFVHGNLPFDWQDIGTIFRANQAIGRGSYLCLFLGPMYPKQLPPCSLYFSADFWVARGYATDKGGEVVRKAIEEAEQFERICKTPTERHALRTRFEVALRDHGPHSLTQAAVDALNNDRIVEALCAEVGAAREALTSLTNDGYPVVYAVRVDPAWLGESWSRHVSNWEEGTREVNLRCSDVDVPADRLVAKVSYPNGTDRDFAASWCSTWDEVLALTRK